MSGGGKASFCDGAALRSGRERPKREQSSKSEAASGNGPDDVSSGESGGDAGRA